MDAVMRDVAVDRLRQPRTLLLIAAAVIGLWILRRALRR
jgi:hypothetical protein